jgi:membrane-associated HD superfamily phosphohydrolase
MNNKKLLNSTPILLVLAFFTIHFFFVEEISWVIYYSILISIFILSIIIIAYNFKKTRKYKMEKKHKLILFSFAILITLFMTFINIL